MERVMFTKTFLKDLFERAIKTAAQTLVLAVGASQGFDLFTADWRTLGAAAAGGFIMSVLSSLASKPFGDRESASVVGSGWVSITTNGSVDNG
jgi:hypothetical protein